MERTPRKTDYLEDHPTRPADVQQDGSEEILPKPSWRTCLYLMDGDTKHVSMEELDQEEAQWVTRQNRGCEKAKMLSKIS